MTRRPDRVGPYRVEGLLGTGGMGAVYRAWDERLKRPVALKQIRPEIQADETARRRFRREAQAVARLSHPAVVQIYDILETPEADWIVMELVEGVSLKQLADKGLSIDQALDLGRQIAEGLAEAHAKGIVHRDLKTENVLVTPEHRAPATPASASRASAGRARILDFGLARAAEPDAEPLSREGGLLGTHRAMSPEQARGRTVDARSDLFSLGTLLYEMTAGVSPFAGPTAFETLTRIVSHHPKTLREVEPETPAELSELVDRLLRKEPAHRPESARQVAAVLGALHRSRTADPGGALPSEPQPFAGETTWADASLPDSAAAEPGGRSPPRGRRLAVSTAVLALVVILAAVRWGVRTRPEVNPSPEPAGGDPLYVAVPEPEVAGGGEAERVGLLASAVRVALLRGLLALEGIAVLAPEQVDPLPGSPADLARATAADEVLTSRVECHDFLCQAVLHRIRGQDGVLLWPGRIELPTEDLRLLTRAVEAYLKEGYPAHRWREGRIPLEVESADYAAYLRLARRAYAATTPEHREAILEQAAALRRSSPRFLEAYLLEGQMARLRFFNSRDPRHLETALEAVRQARALDPGDPRPLFVLAQTAVESDQPELAEQALDELELLVPGDSRARARRAQLLQSRGQGDEGLVLMRSVAEHHPSWRNLFNLAQMELLRGEVSAAREHLGEALDRYPEHQASRSTLAQLELVYGDPRRAAELYAELIERASPASPGLAELSNLGFAHFLLGDYDTAAGVFRRAAELEPNNPMVHLNLADSELLRERQGTARKLYGRVLELTAGDPAAADWQLLTTRAQALAHLGRFKEAIRAVQAALARDPSNALLAFEASLVYALADEPTSAQIHAERALRGGLRPRFFALPWFDRLQERADFRELLGDEPWPP